MDARVWGIVVDSFAKLLIPGITVTIPLTLISFALGLILAIVVALVRVAKVPVASQIAWFYIWVFRGTPLLVQLFVIFFGLPSVGHYDSGIAFRGNRVLAECGRLCRRNIAWCDSCRA